MRVGTICNETEIKAGKFTPQGFLITSSITRTGSSSFSTCLVHDIANSSRPITSSVRCLSILNFFLLDHEEAVSRVQAAKCAHSCLKGACQWTAHNKLWTCVYCMRLCPTKRC